MSAPQGSEGEKASEKKESDGTNVHSANKWESVDLGDDDRKQKFLRLMGATKKSHQGPIVIGERKSSEGDAAGSNSAEIDQELEHQFAESLEHKLSGGARAHLGLGFHDSDQEAKGEIGDIHYKDTQPPEEGEGDRSEKMREVEGEKDRGQERDRDHREKREGDQHRERARSRSPVHHRHHSHHHHHHHHHDRHGGRGDIEVEPRRRSMSEGDHGAASGSQEHTQKDETPKSKYAPMSFVKSSS